MGWFVNLESKPPRRVSSSTQFTTDDKIMSRDASWANDQSSASWRGSNASLNNLEHTSSNIQIALNLPSDSRPDVAPVSDEVLAQCTLIVSGFVSEQS
eukprot:gene41238-51050_t